MLRRRELACVGLVVELLGLTGVSLILRHGLLRVHRLLLVVWNLQRLLGEIIRRHYLHRSCLMQVCYNLRLLLMMHVNLMVLMMVVRVMMVLRV